MKSTTFNKWIEIKDLFKCEWLPGRTSRQYSRSFLTEICGSRRPRLTATDHDWPPTSPAVRMTMSSAAVVEDKDADEVDDETGDRYEEQPIVADLWGCEQALPTGIDLFSAGLSDITQYDTRPEQWSTGSNKINTNRFKLTMTRK